MAATLTSMDCVASSAQEWPASPAGLGISADLGRVSLNNALHGSNGNRTPIGTLTRLIAPLLANNNRTWPIARVHVINSRAWIALNGIFSLKKAV